MDDVVLVGRAVCLEPLQLAHVVQLSRREPRPDARGEGSATVHSLRWTWQSVAAALAAQERGRSLAVALRDIRSDRIVGRAGYASMDHRARHVRMEWPLLNVASSLLELDAVHLLLRHAFETLRCVRVELHVAGRERRTRRAVSSMGAREEGVLRQRVVSESGHVDDLVCYGILDREWPWVNASLRKCLSRATHRDEAPTGRGPVGIAPRP
jgi:RimJ/RimL family protein N-acetyltransferase